MHYEIQPHTRRCAVTDREIRPGEVFYTALFDQGDELIRRDYCAEAWQGPPEGAFSFWRGRVPNDDKKSSLVLDPDFLFECFERLDDSPDPKKLAFRYVVALLLMRKKRLRFVEATRENGQEVLTLVSPKTHTTYRVVNPRLTDEEIKSVQEKIADLLGRE